MVFYRHGGRHKPEYRNWQGMKARCLNPNDKDYPRYGGRGITVCDQWIASFAAFLADMGPRPSPKHSIDRLDNGGNYEPVNCRWATYRQQNNNRRSSLYLVHHGERMSLEEWARALGMAQTTLWNRLFTHNWTVERALSIPVRPKAPNGSGDRS